MTSSPVSGNSVITVSVSPCNACIFSCISINCSVKCYADVIVVTEVLFHWLWCIGGNKMMVKKNKHAFRVFSDKSNIPATVPAFVLSRKPSSSTRVTSHATSSRSVS